jgi:anti-sigma factor RsiW
VRCDFSDSLLQAYFDGELSARAAGEFERHMRHCSRCTTDLVDLDLLRDRLRLAQLYEPATASLRWRINARFHPMAPRTPASKPQLWHWLAAAAALLFIAVALGKLGPRLQVDDYQAELAGEIVESHMHSLQPGSTIGIFSNDERLVTSWFKGKLKFAIPVRDFANKGFALQGGRSDVIEGRPVAVLAYERDGHPINVFMWRTREPETSARTGSRQGFHWVDWRKGKMEFCIVSDTKVADLKQLHELIDSSTYAIPD